MNDTVRRCLLPGLLMLLGACGVTQLKEPDWSTEIPERPWFETRYLSDETNRSEQQPQEYLRWVTRFYYGWLRHPKGWLRVTEQVITALDDADREETGRRMELLGRRIAGEWAKESSHRVIDNRQMATWMKVLPLAARRDDFESVLLRIAADVDALFAGELNATAVTAGRYIPGQADLAAFER